MKTLILFVVIRIFALDSGLLLYADKPVSHLYIYNGPIQEIKLEYYEFCEPVEALTIPYKTGKNIVVVRYRGHFFSYVYVWNPSPEPKIDRVISGVH